MKTRVPTIEIAAVAGFVFIVVFAQWQFDALGAIRAELTEALPWTHGYVGAIGTGLWVGLSVYSLRRRQSFRREVQAHKALQVDYELVLITDQTTGLPNGHGLDVYFTSAAGDLHGRQDLMLIGVYFSNLKVIADVQGAKAASAAAQRLSEHMMSLVRLPDFVACINGRRFYILLRDDQGALQSRAAALVATLASTLQTVVLANGSSLPLSTHIGTVTLSHCFKGTLPQGTEMIRRCDLAVHEASKRGAGSIVAFDAILATEIDRRARIEASLDDSIHCGEIEPYFQPLIDLTTGEIDSFEVLARWKHKTEGWIPPSVFIPIVTEAGRLEEITIMLVDRACRAALAWKGDFKLAFNLSPRSFNNERFMADFLSTIKATHFEHRRIEVEITEDAFVNDASILSKSIAQLKKENISLAIDDFGTGYSSLRHLQIMPFDKIKIDQSFVKDMASNPESRKIVEAIIGLGRSMGLLTIAEGIEGETERAMLTELGCGTGQGFLFSRPMPADDVMAFVDRHGHAKAVAAPALRVA